MSLKKTKNKKQVPKRAGVKERFTELLELPKEIVLNVPKITMLGDTDLIIENYKGIIEYSEGRIRINTAIGVLKLTGTLLTIKEITSEDILINGKITSMEFIS